MMASLNSAQLTEPVMRGGAERPQGKRRGPFSWGISTRISQHAAGGTLAGWHAHGWY